jgi:arylsulfatase A-like enzyme
MNGTGPSISDLDSDEEGDCENTSLLQSHSDRVDAQDDEFDQLFETLPVDYVDSTDEEQLLFRHSMDDEDDDLLGKKVVDKSVSMKDKVKQQSTAKKTLQRDKVICSNHSAFRPIAPAADKKMNEKHVNWGGLDIPKAMVIPTALPISENTQHSNSFKYYGSNALVTDARPLQTTPNSYQAFIDIEHSTTRAFASHYSSNHPTNDDDDLTLMGYPFSFSTCIVGCFLGTLALIFLSDSFAFLFIGNGGNGGKIITSTGKPNIIFILSDDVGYGTLEGKKSTVNYDFTPFLRKLKEEKGAIYFNNYYSQEICTPARASLLTGKYPISLGLQGQEILPNSRGGLDLNETTGLLSTLLQDYGDYKTYMVGKWNLGHYQPNYLPTARGFDYFIGYFSSATTYWKKCLTTNISITDFIYSESDRVQSDFKFRNLKERNSQDDDDENNNNNVLKGLYKKYSESPYESAHPQTSYSTFQYRDIAIEWIKSHDYSQNPLFLYLAFQGSHRPYTDVGKYTDGMPRSYISPPTLYDAVLDYTAGRERQQYALTVLAMDEAILSIVKALDVMQQLENTYLIYASDNGGCTRAGSYNSDLRGSKGSLFEGKRDYFIFKV